LKTFKSAFTHCSSSWSCGRMTSDQTTTSSAIGLRTLSWCRTRTARPIESADCRSCT
jgi:hypothetical protein